MDARSHALALLERQLEEFSHLEPKKVAFAYQDSMQMRSCGMSPEWQFYTMQQKMYLGKLSDAILEICVERFGNYTDSV